MMRFRDSMVALLCLAVACGGPLPDPAHTMLALHERILQAHRDRDAAGLTALEAETTTVANRGRITRSPRSGGSSTADTTPS